MTDSTNDIQDGFCTWPTCRCTARNQCRGTVSYYAGLRTLDRDADPLSDPRVKALVEALRFYANPGSWISNTPYISANADLDIGDIARAALAAFEGG